MWFWKGGLTSPRQKEADFLDCLHFLLCRNLVLCLVAMWVFSSPSKVFVWPIPEWVFAIYFLVLPSKFSVCRELFCQAHEGRYWRMVWEIVKTWRFTLKISVRCLENHLQHRQWDTPFLKAMPFFVVLQFLPPKRLCSLLGFLVYAVHMYCQSSHLVLLRQSLKPWIAAIIPQADVLGFVISICAFY